MASFTMPHNSVGKRKYLRTSPNKEQNVNKIDEITKSSLNEN